MAPVDAVAKAKFDLEQAGQTFTTNCDAYKITNLAAQRMGWKVQEKLGGENCQNRKVDGLIVDGMAIDCLQNAGPPINGNIPVWQVQGPQNAIVAKDPYPQDDPAVIIPPKPDPNPPEPETDLEKRVAALEEQMDYVITMMEQFIEAEFAVILPVERIPTARIRTDVKIEGSKQENKDE